MPGQTLAGKVAIVTGSNAGIGVAIAQELSSRGASVVINYPFPALAEETQGVASGLPTASTSIAVEADLSTEDGPQRLIDAAVARYKTIHILLVGLNARAVFLLVQGILPHLPAPSPSTQDRPQTDGGRIVNIVSISSRAAPPPQTIYGGTKGMVDSMTKVWAKELPPRYGCTVNAVSPGPTMTPGFAAAGDEFMKEMAPVMAQTPVGHRMALPEEIAFGVGFLCEPRASWINGLHLNASGGLYIE
ncbi:hypothetical protein INS49_008836 [Diaporthe citri]|uniref:uncharacterized protein n=1 Tax=Diaporthe citri TaxID=83186 RepID=UPI001C802601|nr:uncharacterized protein INS49_008836 [Diaporthe citri]KAG6363733.1 hypothetical protein INS49_008836 [Diaporthe citri]